MTTKTKETTVELTEEQKAAKLLADRKAWLKKFSAAMHADPSQTFIVRGFTGQEVRNTLTHTVGSKNVASSKKQREVTCSCPSTDLPLHILDEMIGAGWVAKIGDKAAGKTSDEAEKLMNEARDKLVAGIWVAKGAGLTELQRMCGRIWFTSGKTEETADGKRYLAYRNTATEEQQAKVLARAEAALSPLDL